MKKAFLLFLVAVLAASCDGPMGPPGRDGRDGRDAETTQWEIINITVDAWTESPLDQDLYYSASIPMPELTTKFIRDKGTILVYCVLDNGFQQILPYTRYYQLPDRLGNYYYSRTVDYEFTNGEINIYVTDSDFQGKVPGVMFFRVVLIW